MATFRGLSSFRKFVNVPRKNFNRNFASLPPEVVVFPDSEMVVCWHPEQEFPYKYSKPLPPEKEQSQSVLTIDQKEAMKAYSKKRSKLEIAQECAKLTYTTMHIWFPRSRDKKAKKTKPDRPYL